MKDEAFQSLRTVPSDDLTISDLLPGTSNRSDWREDTLGTPQRSSLQGDMAPILSTSLSSEDISESVSEKRYAAPVTKLPFLNSPIFVDGHLVGLLSKVSMQACQPPVIAALCGLIVAAITPVRALLVEVKDEGSMALLSWLFDGIQKIGQAAVPVSMAILGVNLSVSASGKGSVEANELNAATIAGSVLGKLVVMPVIGIVTALALKHIFFERDETHTSFFIVLMVACFHNSYC